MDPKKWPVAGAYSTDFHAPSVESISGALPSFRALTPAWQGAGDTKDAGRMRKGTLGVSFFREGEGVEMDAQ